MAATKQDLTSWFKRGVAENSLRMIVWCDTFDYEDYPEYTNLTGEPLRQYALGQNGKGMKKLMEVYDLTANLEAQMAERRAFHY